MSTVTSRAVDHHRLDDIVATVERLRGTIADLDRRLTAIEKQHETMTCAKAARRLGVPRAAVLGLIRDRKLAIADPTKPIHKWAITVAEVERYQAVTA